MDGSFQDPAQEWERWGKILFYPPERRLFIDQGGRCLYCGIPLLPKAWRKHPNAHLWSVTAHYQFTYVLLNGVVHTESSWEHLVPKSCGGTNAQENMALACKRCNTSRSSHSLRYFLTKMLGEPY